tara:strand:+ start:1700 stop:2299 length:600 start_codon:yes stop_codon:yes gene_type:complete
MALTKGLPILCSDLQRTGGIIRIFLRNWAAGDEATFVNTAGTLHSISSIVDSGGADADWFMFEFKDETPTLSVTATKENGSTAVECVLSFYLPLMNNEKTAVLQQFIESDQCMMGLVVDTNDDIYVLGVSEKYAVGPTTASIYRSQTYLQVTSMEGQTGAAYNEENGITVVMTARQFELPRIYTGTLTPSLSGPSGITT